MRLLEQGSLLPKGCLSIPAIAYVTLACFLHCAVLLALTLDMHSDWLLLFAVVLAQ